jgi:polysaccharide transporter, PST family
MPFNAAVRAVSKPGLNLFKRLSKKKGILESLSNVGWLGGDRVIRMFGAVLIGTLVARYLGPDQFGLLNYGLAIYGLFNIISNLGLDSLVVRDIALDSKAEPHVLGTAFALKGAASIVTTIAAMVAARILDPRDRILIIIVALISFASIAQALDVIDYFFQAHTRSRYTVVPRTAAFILASIAKLIAVLLHASLLTFAWIAALEVLMAELGLLVSYIRYRKMIPRWTWNSKQAKALMTESWPLLISSIMIMIYMRTDQILLGRFSSMTTVGNYTAAIRFSEIWYAIPVIVTSSVMPKLLKTRDANPAGYYSRLQIFYESMILVSVLVTVATLLLGPTMVHLLYGSRYSSASSILSVHIWTGVFVTVGSIGTQQYVHEKLTISSLNRTALGAIANVILNLLWIPRWGGMGSAMATLVAQSMAAYFADGLSKTTRHIFWMKTRAFVHFWLLPVSLLRAQEE